MPRSWRSQIADEVRATSMMKAKCMSPNCENPVMGKRFNYCEKHMDFEPEHIAGLEHEL